MRLRLATYNIHKCKGMDALTRPARVAKVIASLDADLVALQEVLLDQLEVIAAAVPQYQPYFAGAREIAGVPYGNATLSRLPILDQQVVSLSVSGREPRNLLRTDFALADRTLRVSNLHLGTSYSERRLQAELLESSCLNDISATELNVICGDLNEWAPGACSRLLKGRFVYADPRHFGLLRTYPGLLPFLHLDHIYYDRRLELERLHLLRTRLSLVASDHLPLLAEFHLNTK